MEQFTQFMSTVASSGMGGDMVQLFGVTPSNPDSWLQEKGQEVGREVMGKLLQAVYQADGMEPPADAIVTRSFTPADLISNTGLGGGKLADILAPLVAGIVSSITHSGVLNHLVSFATKRVGKTIEEHSDSIARHGESLGVMMIDGLSKIAQSQADAVNTGTHRGQKMRGHKGRYGGPGHTTRDFHIGDNEEDDDDGGEIDLDDIDIDVIDENALLGIIEDESTSAVRTRGFVPGTNGTNTGSSPHLPPPPDHADRSFDAGMQQRGGGTVLERGPGRSASTVIQAVMKPVARGVNTAMKKPGLLQKLVDAVSGLVPIEKIKNALKTTLYPQYKKVCRTFAPHMQKFGGVAGHKIIDFLQTRRYKYVQGLSVWDDVQKIAQVTGQADVDKHRDMCIENTMMANENVERDLMSPLMQPFMSGVLWQLAQSGWKNEIAMGMLKKVFGACAGCFGGKMPQLAGSGPPQGGHNQQHQGGGQYQQNQGGASQGAFMQGQRF